MHPLKTLNLWLLTTYLFVLDETRPVGPVSQPVGQAVGMVVLLPAPLHLRRQQRPRAAEIPGFMV